MKKLKSLKLVKKSVTLLSQKETSVLKGGSFNTHAWRTQVSTCMTYNCCKP